MIGRPMKTFNAPLGAIIAEGFLSRLSFGMISFALPLYARHLGLSLSQIGILVSVNVAVALALKPLSGWAADRFGRKRTFATALGLRSVIALLLAVASVPWQLFAVRTAQGAGKSLRDPAVNALIAEHGGKKAIASAFAWYATARKTAASLGMAFAGILLTLTASNFSLVFAIASALSALPVVLVVLFVREKRPGAIASPEAVPGKAGAAGSADAAVPVTERGARPPLAPFIGLGFLIACTADMLRGLFPILATEYAGLSEAQTGVIYLVSGSMVLVAGPGFGWLSDNVSRKLVLSVRSTANALSAVVYIAAPTFLGIGVGRVVDDMGKAAFRPAWGALMAQVSEFNPHARARTMGLMGMGEDGGRIVGPIIAGLLWSTGGIAAVLGVRVVVAGITEVYAWRLARLDPGTTTVKTSLGARVAPP